MAKLALVQTQAQMRRAKQPPVRRKGYRLFRPPADDLHLHIKVISNMIDELDMIEKQLKVVPARYRAGTLLTEPDKYGPDEEVRSCVERVNFLHIRLLGTTENLKDFARIIGKARLRFEELRDAHQKLWDTIGKAR
jgi:hypothetical protein